MRCWFVGLGAVNRVKNHSDNSIYTAFITFLWGNLSTMYSDPEFPYGYCFPLSNFTCEAGIELCSTFTNCLKAEGKTWLSHFFISVCTGNQMVTTEHVEKSLLKKVPFKSFTGTDYKEWYTCLWPLESTDLRQSLLTGRKLNILWNKRSENTVAKQPYWIEVYG